MNPLLGDRVIYVSKIDNSTEDDDGRKYANKVLSPATVIRTRATNVPVIVSRWGAEPCESCGGRGQVESARDPEKDSSLHSCEACEGTGRKRQETSASPVDGKTHVMANRPDGVLDVLPDDDTIDLLVHGLGKDYREYAVAKDMEGGLGTWHSFGLEIDIDAGPAPE